MTAPTTGLSQHVGLVERALEWDAAMRPRRLRHETRNLERRRKALEDSIANAQAELLQVNASLASTTSLLAACAKPRVTHGEDTTFDVPMSADDVAARLTPSPVKRALQRSWEEVHKRRNPQPPAPKAQNGCPT